MQRYLVTALEPVDLTIEPGDGEAPLYVSLGTGEETVVRRVLRLVRHGTSERTDIIAHPADLSQRVRVSNLLELTRVR